MNRLPLTGRALALLVAAVALLLTFIHVGLRSGPLAPVAVTLVTVESRGIEPALFGIGTVEARYTYRIGPTTAGRVKRLAVNVGDRVNSGQVLGEMDPVDFEDRIRSLGSASRRSEADLREAHARHAYARAQVHRYERLFSARSVSEEALSGKQQELQIADAALSSAHADVARFHADHEGLLAQRNSLILVAPADGVVVDRLAEPGSTVVAGQSVLEIIDPKTLWVNVRFDQISASGLTGGLAANITLRSRNGQRLPGRVLRVEPRADAVTEEILAKVVFDAVPSPLPALGELAEVTVGLPALPAMATISNTAVRWVGGQVGVWKIIDGDLRFSPIRLGASDLNGFVQVSEGLSAGESVVAYSEVMLTADSRINVVEQIPGVLR